VNYIRDRLISAFKNNNEKMGEVKEF